MFLLTRPASKVETSLRRFHAAGLSAFSCPAVDIETLHDINTSQTHYDIGIVTSTYAANWCNEQDSLSFDTIICIGEASRKALSPRYEKNANILVPSEHNSEAVLALPIFNAKQPYNVLIIKGQQGRTLLADQLAPLMASVEVVEVYKRRAIITQKLVRQVEELPIKCIIVTSTEIAEQIIINFERAWLSDKQWIASSQRISQFLQDNDVKNISISQGANDEALIDAAKQLI